MNPLLKVDYYKTEHFKMYPEGMSKLYSNFTPRKSRIADIDKVVFFGLQHFILKYLIEDFNENFFYLQDRIYFGQEDTLDKDLKEKHVSVYKNKIIKEYSKHIKLDSYKHIEDLWDLGYLPIEIKAVEEGTLVSIGVPCFTITNTHPNFAWLVNYLETLISCMMWQPITSATIAYEYKKLLNKYAIETTGNTEGVQWQGHDFSMRGLSSVESAILSGMGHLTSFSGTDVIPAIYQLESSYNATGLIGASVPATEHSVMCMGGNNSGKSNKPKNKPLFYVLEGFKEESPNLYKLALEIIAEGEVEDKIYSSEETDNQKNIYNYFKVKNNKIVAIGEERGRDGGWYWFEDTKETISGVINEDNELKTFRRLLDLYPKGILSVVSDTWDLWKVCTEYLPQLKKEILSRDGKLVIRPDSGDPVDIICGKIFPKGVTITQQQRYEEQGVIELLWDTFGGTINEQGYKVLDSHIGAIYGDSITLSRAKEICERLKAKGFASTNIVLGIGSYTYQYNTRDTFGFAMKATYGELKKCKCELDSPQNWCENCNIECREIFKDPITDDGTKKSKKGLLRVQKDENTLELSVWDQCKKDEEAEGELKTVFKDGKLIRTTSLEEIRNKLKSN